tara:strand:- start:977 stop:1879 length:903 start_codon:yes stop_codon:yes gene_type:complete
MSWIYFALLAPFFWALSNYIDKYSLDKYVSNIYDFLFFSTLTSWFFVPVLILVFGFPTLTIYSFVPILLGIVLIYSYGFYGKALVEGETSRIVILFKLIPVLTLILGFLFLNQTLTGQEFLAFLLVLAGAVIVSFERSESKFKLFDGTKWILIAIGIWSVMFLFADWAMTKMTFEDFFVLDTLGTALAGPIMFLIPSIRRQVVHGLRESEPQKFGWFFANNFLDLFGQMSMKKSLSLAPSAGLVTVAIQIQSLYIVILGVILTLLFPHAIKEDISGKNLLNKALGVTIMFAGIYLLFMTT